MTEIKFKSWDKLKKESQPKEKKFMVRKVIPASFFGNFPVRGEIFKASEYQFSKEMVKLLLNAGFIREL